MRAECRIGSTWTAPVVIFAALASDREWSVKLITIWSQQAVDHHGLSSLCISLSTRSQRILPPPRFEDMLEYARFSKHRKVLSKSAQSIYESRCKIQFEMYCKPHQSYRWVISGTSTRSNDQRLEPIHAFRIITCHPFPQSPVGVLCIIL
jgi:hypothetical protein